MKVRPREETVPGDEDEKRSLATLPSLEDMTVLKLKLGKLVEYGDHVAVEQCLSEHCHVVKVEPKRGCSEIHYSKLCNIANSEDCTGDSPMLKAARVDAKMVNILLKYGGNPNHINFVRDCPLSEAAKRRDRESIKYLLRAGAILSAAVVKLTFSLEFKSSHLDEEFSVKPLAVLCSEVNYLECKDPLQACFEISYYIRKIKCVREEFRIDFESIIKRTDAFTCKLMDQCEGLWEARKVLDPAYKLIVRAINNENKSFLVHPYTQIVLLEDWYGELAYTHASTKFKIFLKYFLSPILLPLYLLFFLFWEKCKNVSIKNSKFGKHMHLLFTPIMCFITEVFNYIILFVILVVVCTRPKRSITPEVDEFLLWACAFSRFLIGINHLCLRGLRNYALIFFDLFICSLLIGSSVVRLKTWKGNNSPTNENNPEITYSYLYAFAEFMLFLRCLFFLELSKSIGHLLIALHHLIYQFLSFILILAACIFGTAVAVFVITNNTVVIGRDPKDKKNSNTTCVHEHFETFVECVKNIMWSTFGLLEVPVSLNYIMTFNNWEVPAPSFNYYISGLF